MSDDPDETGPFAAVDGREYGRVALVLCCVAALLLSATLLPAFAGNAPGESLVLFRAGGQSGGGGTDGGGATGATGAGGITGPSGITGAGGSGPNGRGGLGALNPGSETAVGGPIGDDAPSSPYRSLDTEVHFTVHSGSDAYWRTGSYDRYSGQGWRQTGESRPYDGDLRSSGLRGGTVSYEVTLNRSATALPTVWQPSSVSLDGGSDAGETGGTSSADAVDADDLVVTDGRAIHADDPVPAGTTYTGRSVRPVTDETLLRTAGRDYPEDVEARYTQLPEGTPARVGSFTDELTASSSTPYGDAKAVERWLEANKTYSLDADHGSGRVADQFVFEMDRGYCEYFATAMVVMLRTQEIPSRYVVGYSTGDRVESNTYEVRGMNAHAWVEVYFPDVGWVQFDPTPGRARQQTEQRAIESEDPNASYEPTERGSPGEVSSLNASANSTTGRGASSGSASGSETGTSNESADADADADGQSVDESQSADSDGPSYDVQLNRTAVPGARVTATVTYGDSPVADVTVLFNGDPVGRTDADGTVVATVPYTKELDVTISAPEVDSADGAPSAALDSPPAATFGGPTATTRGGQSATTLAAPSATTIRYSLRPPSPSVLVADESGTDASATNNTTAGSSEPGDSTADESWSYRLSTDASLAVSGETITGGEVVVAATVQGVPVRGAAVTLDGERVGTTDRSGRANVTLPTETGNVTLGVARGEISGERTLTLQELSLAVDPADPLALPLRPVTVRARLGNRSVEGAVVRVGDERAGETGGNGTLAPTLPLTGATTVSVSKYGQTSSARLSGLYTNAALLVGLPLLVLLGVGALAYRRGLTPLALLRALAGLGRYLLRKGVEFLVGAAALVTDLSRRAALALRELLTRSRSLAEVLADFRAWILGAVADARTRATTRRDETGRAADGPTIEDESYVTIRDAWATFLGHTSLRRPRTMSAAEIAAHAVAVDDLPEPPVLDLRDAFREVTYGGRDPRARLQRVDEALDAIEAHVEAAKDAEDAADAADAENGENGENGEAPAAGDDDVRESAAGDAATGDVDTGDGDAAADVDDSNDVDDAPEVTH